MSIQILSLKITCSSHLSQVKQSLLNTSKLSYSTLPLYIVLNLQLHNQIWWVLLHMNLKKQFDSNSKQFPALSCMSNTSVFYPMWHLVKQNTQYCMWHLEQLLRPCQLWLASFHDHQSESHPSTLITVKQQENRLYGRLIGTKKKRELRGRETINLPIHLTPFSNCISMLYHTILWEKDSGVKQKDERKTELSSSSEASIKADSIKQDNCTLSLIRHINTHENTH